MLKTEVFDPRFHDLIDVEQDLTEVVTGCIFTEGTAWNSKTKSLIFSDIPANRIYRWSDKDGASVIREWTNKTNGNAYDAEGRVISCEASSNRVVRTNDDMTGYEVLASHYNNEELNGPNDVAVSSAGLIYFTDPNLARRPATNGLARPCRQPSPAVYSINPETLELKMLCNDGLGNPNGICFSTDEKRLFVNDSNLKCIWVFDVLADGTIANKTLFGKCPTLAGHSAPDGMRIDIDNNVWLIGPGGVHVFANDGTLLGAILMPVKCGNLCFGMDDMKTLFIACGGGIFSVKTKIAGSPLRY